jgi:hypothetical protein
MPSDGVENLDAFSTTIVVRVCLNALRARSTRREEPMGAHVPDPLISRVDQVSPEDEVLLADSVGLALQVVLESPVARLEAGARGTDRLGEEGDDRPSVGLALLEMRSLSGWPEHEAVLAAEQTGDSADEP